MTIAEIEPRLRLIVDRLRMVEQMLPRDAAAALEELGHALLEVLDLLDELRTQENPDG